MLKMIVEKQVLLIIAGVFMALGIGSKCVVDATLRKVHIRLSGWCGRNLSMPV